LKVLKVLSNYSSRLTDKTHMFMRATKLADGNDVKTAYLSMSLLPDKGRASA